MGLHIIPYKIKGRDSESGYFITEQVNVPGFDTARHSGDREFAATIWELEDLWISIDDSDVSTTDLSAERYHRPKGPSKLISWVHAHIEPEGNRKRLYALLEAFELDPELYIYLSY